MIVYHYGISSSSLSQASSSSSEEENITNIRSIYKSSLISFPRVHSPSPPPSPPPPPLHPPPPSPPPLPSATLHVYDAADNSLWFTLGGGLYYCGVEVEGVEFSYGRSEGRTCGIFSSEPLRMRSVYALRESIDLGPVSPLASYLSRRWVSSPSLTGLWSTMFNVPPPSPPPPPTSFSPLGKTIMSTAISVEVVAERSHPPPDSPVTCASVVRSMAESGEWTGATFDARRKNSVTFARDLCAKLGVDRFLPGYLSRMPDLAGRMEEAATFFEGVLFVQEVERGGEEEGERAAGAGAEGGKQAGAEAGAEAEAGAVSAPRTGVDYVF